MVLDSRGYSLKEFEGWVVNKSLWPKKNVRFFMRARGGVLTGHHNPSERELFRTTLRGVPSGVDAKAKKITLKFDGKQLEFVVKTVYELQGWKEVLEDNETWHLSDFYVMSNRVAQGPGRLYEEYAALRRRDSRKVTVRVARFDGQTEDAVKRVRQDIAMLETVQHRGMARVLDVLESEYTLYLVFPRFRGTVAALLEHGVDDRAARRVAHQLLDCLAQLHKAGYAHTALNEDSVRLIDRESLRVTDYHNSARIDKNGYLPLDHVYGRGKYLAPECLASAPCTTKVDIWAVGVLLFALLAKRTPWSTGHVEEIYVESADSDSFFRNVDASVECKDLIRKMLALDQSKRISAEEALNHPWFRVFN